MNAYDAYLTNKQEQKDLNSNIVAKMLFLLAYFYNILHLVIVSITLMWSSIP